METNYITGDDALDIARLTGIQLHRSPAKVGADPDTDWTTAQFLINNGADEDEFYIDLERLPAADAASIILSLVGMWKAVNSFKGA